MKIKHFVIISIIGIFLFKAFCYFNGGLVIEELSKVSNIVPKNILIKQRSIPFFKKSEVDYVGYSLKGLLNITSNGKYKFDSNDSPTIVNVYYTGTVENINEINKIITKTLEEKYQLKGLNKN